MGAKKNLFSAPSLIHTNNKLRGCSCPSPSSHPGRYLFNCVLCSFDRCFSSKQVHPWQLAHNLTKAFLWKIEIPFFVVHLTVCSVNAYGLDVLCLTIIRNRTWMNHLICLSTTSASFLLVMHYLLLLLRHSCTQYTYIHVSSPCYPSLASYRMLGCWMEEK